MKMLNSYRQFICFFVVVLQLVSVSSALKCLYLHGIGNHGPLEVSKVPFPERPKDPRFMLRNMSLHHDFHYWAQVPKFVPPSLCENYYYTTDSALRGWDDDTLQQEFCLAILTVNPDVVFTHSMGNLVIAAGIGNEHPGCTLISDRDSLVHWYGIAGPLEGAESATLVTKLCSIVRHIEGASNFALDLINGDPSLMELHSSVSTHGIDVVSNIKFCHPSYETLTRKYLSKTAGETAYVQTNCPVYTHDDDCITVKDIATEFMKGSMCGFSPLQSRFLHGVEDTFSGLGLGISAAAIEKLLTWENKDGTVNLPYHGNDGFVGASSCRISVHQFNPYHPVPTAPYYAFNGNHRDATCFVSDDPSVPDKQPCTWMVNMIKRAAIANKPPSSLTQRKSTLKSTVNNQKISTVNKSTFKNTVNKIKSALNNKKIK